MKVILLKDIPRLGKKYDIKKVNDGFAVNSLFPKKLAKMATPKAIKELETKKKEIEISNKVQEDLLLKNLSELKEKTITIKTKANETGSIFSAIHKKEIIETLKKDHGIELSEEIIQLEKPIKEVGEHTINIKIKDKKGSFKLIVNPE